MADNDGGIIFRGGLAFSDNEQDRPLDGFRMVDDPAFQESVQTAGEQTFVTFKNFDGSPVVGKNVVITLTQDGTDIQDITVEAI